ncbi:MAG: phosphotransferase, partial [Bacillota bacterium]
VSVELAKKLIEEQFPGLAPATPVLIGEGWDNSIYSVNGEYLFRFPRRTIVVEMLTMGSELLPAVAQELPLPIPAPIFLGAPSTEYPWPFTGARLVKGEPPGRLSHEQRMRAVEPLAKFLRALHDFPVDRARELGAPNDRLGRLDMGKRKPMLAANAAKLIECGYVQDGQAVQEFLSSFGGGELDRQLALLHGDLHFRNLIVDPQGDLAGVIDWDDTYIGHPAADLSIVYSLLPPEGRRQFFAIYGDMDAVTKSYARFVGVYIPTVLTLYGHDRGDMDLVAAAREYIQMALVED